MTSSSPQKKWKVLSSVDVVPSPKSQVTPVTTEFKHDGRLIEADNETF